jgi:hypothetical protein
MENFISFNNKYGIYVEIMYDNPKHQYNDIMINPTILHYERRLWNCYFKELGYFLVGSSLIFMNRPHIIKMRPELFEPNKSIVVWLQYTPIVSKINAIMTSSEIMARINQL